MGSTIRANAPIDLQDHLQRLEKLGLVQRISVKLIKIVSYTR